MPRILHPLVITMAVLAAGACSQLKPAPATLGHLDARTAHEARQAPPAAEPIVRGDHSPRPPETPAPARAATAATAPHAPATPAPPQPQRAYSLDVHDIAVAELLLAMGRDAGLDLDLHPGIEGRITLRAQDQPLRELLERIARQADIRYELRGRHLVVRPDSAEIRAYALDYVNLSREMRGTVATSTQIATTGSAGQNAANGGGSGNASVTQIETRASNDFWAALEANLVNILADSGPGARRCGGDTAASACHSPNVMINRESGVLMVRATARQHEHLRTFLGSVQQAARRQVMIEATIVEVTLADGYRQGIDWTRLGVPGWNIRPRGSGDARPGAPTVSYLSTSTDVRLELLETFGTVKVLSSPRLSVLNNQTAMLKVVEEVVYFLVDSTTTEYDDRKQARITATTTPQSSSIPSKNDTISS